MDTVEYRKHSYHYIITIADRGVQYNCSQSDIYDIFYDGLGKKIQNQYVDGITIFRLGKKQVQTIINFFN